MIYTVTLNPSMDFFVDLDQLSIGKLNRMNNDYKVPGGKGINISRVLRQLGMPSVATGFIGGYTGQFIEDWLEMEDIQRGFIRVDDDSRINIKLLKQEEKEIQQSTFGYPCGCNGILLACNSSIRSKRRQ